MTPDISIAARPPVFVDAVDEHRLHRRFRLLLSGRFMRENKDEHACRVNDISVGGVSLKVEGIVASEIRPGEKIIAYIDKLGGLEGQVVRVTPEGFSISINATQHKREKLASQLTFLVNEQDLKAVESRRDERFAIGNRSANLTVTDGVYVPCIILDVSYSGASIACTARPEIGSEVWIGRLRGRVVRHHEEGIGIQFMENLDLSTLMAYFG